MTLSVFQFYDKKRTIDIFVVTEWGKNLINGWSVAHAIHGIMVEM